MNLNEFGLRSIGPRKVAFGPLFFRPDWNRYNRLSLEDGQNPTFLGYLENGQMCQEKSRLDYGPFVRIGLGE
jgi:hypothetical protein